jgi:hypothetical protein
LILPTAANITTAAGDTAIFVSLGSGNWKCLSYTRASGTALSSSSSTVPYVKLQEQQSSGTDAGTFTSGAQRTRVLNTETDPSSLCTLSSNQFVLASGTWEILAFAPASYVNYHQAFLRNVTSGTNELVGSTEFTINGGAVATRRRNRLRHMSMSSLFDRRLSVVKKPAHMLGISRQAVKTVSVSSLGLLTICELLSATAPASLSIPPTSSP